MGRSLGLCNKINSMNPYDEETRKLEEELFENRLPKSSNILAPMQIDYGHQVQIHKNVFINHSICMSAAAGIEIEEAVQIAPQVTLLTVNHDLKNKIIVKCSPIRIKKGAWIGARAIINPGVTIGENAVVGAGAVVTKDVPDNTVVVGNPARVIKTIE
ncbi:MAG: sugar O-acetyltransferase [Bacteroidetes bacterium]|nr:sugar O-acetyltransferase [Bacteroidota bacterium]